MLKVFVAAFSGAILLTVGAAYLVIVSGWINPGADEAIPEIERWAAKTSLRAHLKRETSKINNPLPNTAENLKQGTTLYLNNCAVCHGFADGQMSNIGQGLYKKPPLLPNEDWSKDPDDLIYWFIDHGVRLTGMPAYNKTLSKDEMWKIVMFIKNMKQLPPDVDKYWKSVTPFKVEPN